MAFVPCIPVSSRSRLSTSVTTTRRNRCVGRSRQTPSMVVVSAGSVTEMDTILDKAKDTLVIVDYSTTWCAPCRVIAPFFEDFSEKYTDVVFVKVMGDETPESKQLMTREGIRSVPAFHFWKGGEKVKEFIGAKTDDLEKAIVALK